MKIHHMCLLPFLLIHVLVSATNTELEDYNDKTIKTYKTLKQNRSNQFNDEDKRIVGGNASSVEKHPYIVSIQQVEGSHICGGSIIGEWWVLSASHCITENKCEEAVCKKEDRDVLKDPREFQIYAGTSDLAPRSTGAQIREISMFVKHPSFSRPLLHNDIALIKIKNPFIFDKKVNVIHLPRVFFLRGRDVSESYKECQALGWGARKPRSGKTFEELSEQEKLEIEHDLVSPILMEVSLPIIPIRWCQNLINRMYITSRHLCTMYVAGGKDACEGDSGGPLVCKKNNLTLQYGITSWGHGCARPHTPAVFTRTDSYYDWIQRIKSGGPNVDYYSSSNRIVCAKWFLFIYVVFHNKILYF